MTVTSTYDMSEVTVIRVSSHDRDLRNGDHSHVCSRGLAGDNVSVGIKPPNLGPKKVHTVASTVTVQTQSEGSRSTVSPALGGLGSPDGWDQIPRWAGGWV